MNLAKRSFFSIRWNFLANLAMNGVTFVRAIILARLLPVEVFGIFAGYQALLIVTITLTEFGMLSAYIHQSPETENEEQAAAMHFSLRLLFLFVWMALAISAVFAFLDASQRTPVVIMILTATIFQLTLPAQAVLMKRVDHRRIAVVNTALTLVHALIAVTAAWLGWGLYALIIADLGAALVTFAGFYWIRPVWRIRLAWYQGIFRYYLDFGRRAYAATFLYQLLDQVDDLWTRFQLGEAPLGFYSKAYRFASFPRTVLANPISLVIGGTYAALKTNRAALSQAFFHVNAYLIRSGFLLAGWMALIAPEFIRLLLTDKWSPMLDAFRLMLLFALLDPLKLSIAEVLNAMGKPEKIVFTRVVQLICLLIGLAILSPRFGIAGVALSVDFMLVVGITILLVQARRYVDFSAAALFFAPFMAMAAGIGLTQGTLALFGATLNDVYSIAVKTILFGIGYLFVLVALERERLLSMWKSVMQVLRSTPATEESSTKIL
jgi:O-antigen/teichoic acid export membrane protein